MRNRSTRLGITDSEQCCCINPSRFFIPRRVWNTLLYHVGQPYPSRLFQVGQCYSEQVILNRAPLFRVGIPSTAALGKPFQNRKLPKAKIYFFSGFSKILFGFSHSQEIIRQKNHHIYPRQILSQLIQQKRQLGQILVSEIATMFQNIFVLLFPSVLKR